MRLALTALILVAAATACFAADEPVVRVQFFHREGQRLPAEAEPKVANWTVEFLKSSNFNTVSHPEVLKQSVPQVQERYRKAVAGNYVVTTYDRPVTIRTVGGDVTVVEIVVALNTADLDEFPSGLFTVDGEGRVVGHEKYAGRVPPELRKEKPAAAKGNGENTE